MSQYIKFSFISETLCVYIDRPDNIALRRNFKSLLNRLSIMTKHFPISGASKFKYYIRIVKRILGYIRKDVFRFKYFNY